MNIEQILTAALEHGASDIHLQVGSPPQVRVVGQMRAFEVPPLTDSEIRHFIHSLGPPAIREHLDSAMVAGRDFSYSLPNGTRFRCNLYSHLGTPGLAIRVILPTIRTLEELHLPAVIGEMARARRGMLLMSGASGSGKTTTLAAIVDLLNSEYALKILTIEDPVEYEHAGKQSLVSHVEVGRDTPSFEHGLRQAMRQAPDVILIGELRDTESVRMALRAADTGHQVLATIHSANAPQTIERLLAMVPINELTIARQQLAASLVGVVSQRLATSLGGERWPVVEALRGDSVTAKYIFENRVNELYDYIATAQSGMQTFDRDLRRLVQERVLSIEQALEVATNPEALSLEIRLAGVVEES